MATTLSAKRKDIMPPNGSAGPDDGEGFTKVERKKQKKLDKRRPQFQFDTSQFRNGRKITPAHIRDLILYLVADGTKPTWILPEHKSLIAHTVVLFVPGLLPEHLGLAPIPLAATLPFSTSPSLLPPKDTLPPARLPIIRKLFTYGCPTRAPGDQRRMFSSMNTLLQGPMPDDVRKQKEAESRKLAALAKADSSSALTYLLTPHQMIDNDYKLPSYIAPSDQRIIPGLRPGTLAPEIESVLNGPPSLSTSIVPDSSHTADVTSMNGSSLARLNGHSEDGWVETPEATDVPENGLYPVLAIDCEMVVTEDGQALARLSVIDFQSGLNIFDELVKPPKPVIDYRTQWSGITPEKLATATHTLSSIQHALLSSESPIITPHTILLGHSLECDLGALRIRHPLCIDTALIFRHPRGAPWKPGLKWLAQKWLDREIQASDGGHDSEEDARACVDLLKLKFANGPDFGSFADFGETIFERMTRFTPDPERVPGKTSAMIDTSIPRQSAGNKATTVVKCDNDDGVIQAMIDQAEKHDFVFGRLMELADVQGWSSDKITGSSLDSDSPEKLTIDQALANLDRRISNLHASLPPNTAFIILNGNSNPLPMLELTQRRQKWERLVKTTGSISNVPEGDRWLAEDDRALEARVSEAREGMAFFCVKVKPKEETRVLV
ncbi:hypothetical protein BCR39DRAFT_544313 [Naematelia encephala]|uniref:Exonuclease domain-containing protein n=1 Tax=Naematelia encephala TaxID=71784 RepID=A0A1Y2ARX2_9TREE|nr:hypothetical protein BCR39DRAFT_544313 [Naematelia encephala]